jgi:RNA polymerase sigma factor (sigma-70 family)
VICYRDVLTDDALLEMVKREDLDAFRRLIGRHDKLILKVALTILRDQSEAQALAQEAMFEIYAGAMHFTPSLCSAKSWILNMVYSRGFDRLHCLNGPKAQRERAAAKQTDESGSAAQIVINPMTVEKWVGLVEKSLSKLSRAEREIVRKACYERHSMQAIAQMCGDDLDRTRVVYWLTWKKLRRYAGQLMEREPAPATALNEG